VAVSLIYVFGALPVQVAVFGQMGLSEAQAASWLFVTWLTSGLVSLVVAWVWRQPAAVTLSLPCLVYLGTVAHQFSFAEMMGALLLAGAVILAMGATGLGARATRWAPVPIVMGMFAGTLFTFATRLVDAAAGDVLLAGPAVAGYFIGRAIGNPRVPPVGLAVLLGGAGVLASGLELEVTPAWSVPTPTLSSFALSGPAVLSITLPMVLLTVGIGNLQGFAFLQAQGYSVRQGLVTVIAGLSSIVNAAFGGHTAGVGQSAVAIGASSDSGPSHGRYWAVIIPSAVAVLVAFIASPVVQAVNALPPALVLTVGGLAMLPPLQSAFERAFGGSLKLGALVAFAVAATPFAFGGIPSNVWAILAGVLVSAACERGELLGYWRTVGGKR
jgi:benzoate membrane transport protein